MMVMKSETAKLRICGNCMHASRKLESREIQKLKGNVNYLVFLRRYYNPLRDKKTLCRKEDIEVGVLEEACAFWKSK